MNVKEGKKQRIYICRRKYILSEYQIEALLFVSKTWPIEVIKQQEGA